MAVLGSIRFKRTLKQFLDCDDLEGAKALALIEKLRSSSKDSLEQLIQLVPETSGSHQDKLIEICVEKFEGDNEDLFLRGLDNDVTEIRSAAVSILSKTTRVNVSKLFQKLHEPNVQKSEIINILAAQREQLKPEQLITNALKLDQTHAEQLFKLAPDSKFPLNMDVLRFDPVAIGSPAVKIMLLRYFAQLDQDGIGGEIAKFLPEANKTVVLEALKALRNLKGKFDALTLMPYIESMSEDERSLAIEVLKNQANAEMVPRLAPWSCGKSDELREIFIQLFIKYATPKGLETFLVLLGQQEWWGADRSLKCLHKLGTQQIFSMAESLTNHGKEFVREQAQKLATKALGPADLEGLWAKAKQENWQVRESAIEALGLSDNREAIGILKNVLKKWPESAPAILKAASLLGFSKGLEIAFDCLRMPEALVQREALETVGNLANKRHAKVVRDKLMQKVPTLQVTVRDTAGEVVNRLTEEYDLPVLDVDQKTYFDTSLLKFEDTQSVGQGSAEVAATPLPQNHSIEDFKQGDLWLERYRIDREIGRGAMGRVMLAVDEMVSEPMILKFMHPELTAEASSLERFLREVKYSRKVSHPNVIRIHDLLSKDNLSAISMEYFESRGIDEYMQVKKLCDAGEALAILLQVANGMAAAHNQNVIHRDLKPSNVLINDTGLVKVVDFGIASASTETDATLTKTGSIIGTPAYLSPERAKGKEADNRSDIYALGIIAYSMLIGKVPYSGEPMSILFQHLEGKAPPVHEIRSQLGLPVSKLIQKMMAVELKDRYQTMEEVADAIKQVQQEIK